MTAARGPGSASRALVVLLLVAVLSACQSGGGEPAPPSPSAPMATAEEAARGFLDSYVDDDGRVVRHDQGGDTVSEGQAYAMLVAAAIGDRKTFTDVWTWTTAHLLRPNGLLSWRWADGAVVDPSSASDADLDAARALVVAGRVFAAPDLVAEGVALGQAVLDLETVQTGAGRVLVAGDWARSAPYPYNPSYASPVATAVLAEASGDPRWAELATGSRTVTAALLAKADLPPDWAQVQQDGTVEAMPGALGRGVSVRYGYDAARTPVRLAESCSAEDRALAADMVTPLSRAGSGAQLDLGGTPLDDENSVVAAMGQAAAAAAAGNENGAVHALGEASRLQKAESTYYGAAWDALGRALLTDDTLGGCPPLPRGD